MERLLQPLARANAGCLLWLQSQFVGQPASTTTIPRPPPPKIDGRISSCLAQAGSFLSVQDEKTSNWYFILPYVTVPWEVHINSDGRSDKKHFNDMKDKIRREWLIHSSTLTLLLLTPIPIPSFEIISTLLEQIWRLQKSSADRTWRDVVIADLCTQKPNNTLLMRTATAALPIYF